VPYCTNCGGQGAPGENFCVTCGTPTSLATHASGNLPYFPATTSEATTIPQLANFWWRLLGFGIDAVILYVIVKLPLRGLHLSYVETAVTFAVATFFYGSLLIGLANGQTLGMKMCGLRCVNAADQGRVTLQQAFLRSAGYGALLLLGSFYQFHNYANPTPAEASESAGQILIVLCLSVPHYLDLLWMTWDQENQTLHDKFARTIVLRPVGYIF
jgi:uncharacterized RDD family membrane protein YckC